jgi:hypothetical protein
LPSGGPPFAGGRGVEAVDSYGTSDARAEHTPQGEPTELRRDGRQSAPIGGLAVGPFDCLADSLNAHDRKETCPAVACPSTTASFRRKTIAAWLERFDLTVGRATYAVSRENVLVFTLSRIMGGTPPGMRTLSARSSRVHEGVAGCLFVGRSPLNSAQRRYQRG